MIYMKKKPKKCPVCNSSRFTESEKGVECKKCGYVNKKEVPTS